MNLTMYYHTYLDDRYLWAQLFMEKFKIIEDSNLKPEISKVRITAITQDDPRTELFYKLCSQYNMNIEIEFIHNMYDTDEAMMKDLSVLKTDLNRNVNENYTMKKIWDDCLKEDQLVLYLHAKGITSITNNLIPGLVSKFRNRYYWRQFLYHTISDWRTCVSELNNGYDTAGVDYATDPSEHYRGNFFWTKSEHVRKLPNPMTFAWWQELKARKNHPWLNQISERFATEQWLCSLPETKSFNCRENKGDYIHNDI